MGFISCTMASSIDHVENKADNSEFIITPAKDLTFSLTGGIITLDNVHSTIK